MPQGPATAAGYSENADWNVGRLLDAVEEMGDLENTLVFYIWGDNGASMEGTVTGSFNEMTFLNGLVLDAEHQLQLIDEYGGIDALGSDHTAPHYAAAWAHAGNTPFQWGKQMGSHLGGTRDPMVVAWPGRIKARGELRAQFTHCIDVVASDPTVSRLIDCLAGDVDAAVAAIRDARAVGRARVWSRHCPVPSTGPVVVDLYATLVPAHPEKEGATPTVKRTFGFHPVLAFVDHGGDGTRQPLATLLREGRATANDTADHIGVLDAALAQLPADLRHRVLFRGDTGCGVHAVVEHVAALGLEFSVGIRAHDALADTVRSLPEQCWRPAIDGDENPREGAQVAELTRWLPRLPTPWPPGTRILARREVPHPGPQLRLTDVEGRPITLFATNTVADGSPSSSCGTGCAPAPRTASKH